MLQLCEGGQQSCSLKTTKQRLATRLRSVQKHLKVHQLQFSDEVAVFPEMLRGSTLEQPTTSKPLRGAHAEWSRFPCWYQQTWCQRQCKKNGETISRYNCPRVEELVRVNSAEDLVDDVANTAKARLIEIRTWLHIKGATVDHKEEQ